MPFYIRQLDFKSKEELQQMPQTEEEHLENQNLDNDDSDRSQPDAEVSFSVQCVYALLMRITLITMPMMMMMMIMKVLPPSFS